ncbi:hypothetical protein [Saccharopolyspora sp. NPDC002376]
MSLDNVSLARLDVPDSPQLRARMAELTRPGGVELQPTVTYGARDQSGCIAITVDRSRMVTSVWIRSGWPDCIRPDAFPDVLYNTYMIAIQRALAVEFSNRPAPQPSAPATDDTYVDAMSLSPEEWVHRTRSQLNAIDDEYDAIRRRQQALLADVTEIRSPLGYLTMQVRGGGPIAISGNPQALDNPSGTVLSEDILQLFVRAGLGVGQGERFRQVQPQSDRSSEAVDECFESSVAEDDHFADLNNSGWLE